jgi:uncharacterized membrane protein
VTLPRASHAGEAGSGIVGGGAAVPRRSTRRGYLDWLRGIAVLIMIEAHTLDSWTRLADRHSTAYGWAMILGGFGAPAFLFLAGIAIGLAAGSRQRRGLSEHEVARLAFRRGLQIFGYAFLFRLQAWIVSGGAFQATLLKVDILNVMGLAMLAGAALWVVGRNGPTRAVLMVAAATAVAMLTPIIREWSLLAWLPDPIEGYLRSAPGKSTFTLFPWAGFLLAGGAIGVWLDDARTPDTERRVNLGLAAIGIAVAAGGYAASFLPAIYPVTSFWTSSPTFFVLRLGILILTLPLAYGWNALWRGWSPIREFGVASLFVYWIHVEMVYGSPSASIHRTLPFPVVAVAFAAFSVFLFGLVKLRDAVWPLLRGGPPGTAKNRPGPRIFGHLLKQRAETG